jgi:hypothetical protein
MTDQPAATEADLIAARVLEVPGVAGLHGGAFGEVATYLPGRRVLGVRLTDPGCAVHIVVGYPHNVVDVADAVHDVVAPLAAGPVVVTVEDVAPANHPTPAAAGDPEGTSR